jgi:hypothetical protein
MIDRIERELNGLYEKTMGAKPVAMVFTPYEIEHLLNLIQLGMGTRKREIYRARRRGGGLRPMNRWERHLLLMDRKVAEKVMKACRMAFGEENP